MTALAAPRETFLLTGRSLRSIPRVPERLLDVTIQPIVFILLFLFVFGSAVHVPGVSYKDYMFPGIIGQSLAFGIIGAGVATSNDMSEGVIDRFRSMPISRLAIISAQVTGQFIEQLLGMVIVVGVRAGARVEPASHAAPRARARRADGARDVRVHVGRRAVRDARPLTGCRAGSRVHGRLPAHVPRGDVRADCRHGRGPARDRRVGSDLGARRRGPRSHAGHPVHRVLAARSPRAGDARSGAW